jgi:hypothetical protein
MRNQMIKLKTALGILMATTLLCLPGVPGAVVSIQSVDRKIGIKPNLTVMPTAATLVAQNSTDTKANDPSKGADTEGSEKDQKTKTTQKAPQTEGKTEPVKPFVPSEAVKAEQAVDFPYDI